MATLYYVDGSGKYLGGFDGAQPPAGSVEVDNPPANALETWDGSKWVVEPSEKDAFVDGQRIDAYNDRGASIDELVVALWERVVEGDSASSDAIEIIRQKVKQDFPK